MSDAANNPADYNKRVNWIAHVVVTLIILVVTALVMMGLFGSKPEAQFLIPIAVSLGFGILFATLITLFIVPINYLILEDF